MRANDDFMMTECEICHRDDVWDVVCSSLVLSCGYGSEHDTETVSLKLCGECADKLYKFIQKERVYWL